MRHFIFHRGAAFALLFCLCFVKPMYVSAQQSVTITGSLEIKQPYPIYLKDYANPSLDKLTLTLNYFGEWETKLSNLKLKMSLEKGNSLITESQVVVVGASPVALPIGNAPKTLTSIDLAPFFVQSNLMGLGTTIYDQPLTEGVYRLTFRVYDANDNLMNGSISYQFWIVQNEPPLLNAPLNGENVQTPAGTPLSFQWIPRAIENSAGAEYEFTLVKVLNENESNTQQFLTGTPVQGMPITTSNTMLSYALPLDPEGTYAWRVRAKPKVLTGSELNLYKNDGYSNVFIFKNSVTCVKPTLTPFGVVAKSSSTITATWDLNAAHYSYRVSYRKYSVEGKWEWFIQETANTYLNLLALEPSTEYEIKVAGVCGPNLATYSNVIRRSTLAKDGIFNVSCNDPITSILGNTPSITLLIPTDVILAGDFPVTLTRVQGSNGSFSGEGYVQVPWISTKIKVKFNNIDVNEDKKMTRGFLETFYDPNWANIVDADVVIEEIKLFFDLIQDLIDSGIENSRINQIVDQIKNQIEQNLPPELVASLNAALADMKDAKAAYEAAKQKFDSLPPGPEKEKARQDMEAAKAKFAQAKEALKQVQTLKEQLVKDAANIIRLALKAIVKDYNDTKVQVNEKLTLSTTNLEQKFPVASLSPVSDITSMEGVASSNTTTPLSEYPFLSANEKEVISAYLTDEFAANRLVVAKLFSTSLDNDADAAKLASELKKDGKDLGKYIYERKKANATEDIMVKEVKEVLYKKIENILIVKIYKK